MVESLGEILLGLFKRDQNQSPFTWLRGWRVNTWAGGSRRREAGPVTSTARASYAWLQVPTARKTSQTKLDAGHVLLIVAPPLLP